ncbi:MAG: AAA family ATPase [Armatimonadota bacterium]
MIPVRLELKNFMSYGEEVTPLEFRGMHLACLSGENGNGKSALLDAITWALWGEARASADELIRLGASEMRVIFDFEIGGNLYRVIRGRAKKSAGNVWEIYVSDGGEFRSITGQGIRDTGRVIQNILRMDYKTFINSAYIQQGRADEFTKQTVADRKKILGEILDLSRYDALEQMAKEKRAEAERLLDDISREIEYAETELSGEEGYRRSLKESQEARKALEAEIAAVEERLRGLTARRAELDSAGERAAELGRQMQAWRAEVESLSAQRAEQEERIARNREMIAGRATILSGVERLGAARGELARYEQGLSELRGFEHEKAVLSQQILAEEHRLDLERQSRVKALAELQSKLAGAEGIRKDAETLRARIAELEALEARRSELAREVTAQSDRLGELKAAHEGAVREKQDREEKLALISQPGALCPLCKSELGHDKHEAVIADYRGEIEMLTGRIAELVSAGRAARTAREAAEKETEGIDSKLRSGLETRKRLAQAEQMLFAAEEYEKELPRARAKLEELSAREVAADERRRITELEGSASALQYDAQAHERLREELSELAKYESLSMRLAHAEENLAADESGLANIGKLISAREESVTGAKAAVAELEKSLVDLPQVAAESASVAEGLAVLRESDREVTGRIATLTHSLERCAKLREQVAGRQEELRRARTDRAAYDQLVAAFGKKGVQALIIENAIPELQDEANNLLSRMTDNAMQVTIETVRDKKTGGTAETLDIRISDDMGTRSYELYSGGEAFRVNFALRIALSKLLARRAGAALQTLIIDEGFGTQDAKGREKLVEAIDSIKDDFELILVITHIDELKDAFPTRIEVTKDSSGSQISVD